MCINFCFKPGGTAAEIYERLKFSVVEDVMSSTRTLDWFSLLSAVTSATKSV
jgi:hypothetical protein